MHFVHSVPVVPHSAQGEVQSVHKGLSAVVLSLKVPAGQSATHVSPSKNKSSEGLHFVQFVAASLHSRQGAPQGVQTGLSLSP